MGSKCTSCNCNIFYEEETTIDFTPVRKSKSVDPAKCKTHRYHPQSEEVYLLRRVRETLKS